MPRQGRLRAGTTVHKRGLLLLVLMFLSIFCSIASCEYVFTLSIAAPDTIGVQAFNPAPMVYYRMMAVDTGGDSVTTASTQVTGTLQMTVIISAMLMATTSPVVSTQSTAMPDSRFSRETLTVFRPRKGHSSLSSPTTTSLSCSSTRVAYSSTPTIDDIPDAPTLSLPPPSSESFPMDGSVPATSQHGFSNEFQERSGGLPEVSDNYAMSESHSDMSDLEQAQQQGHTDVVVWDPTSAASALDCPGNMQTYKQSRFTIDPTVIDPRVGMSVPVADTGSALQVCMAAQPLASSPIASTIDDAVLLQTNAHDPSSSDIQRLPQELKLEVMAHAYVYPGGVIKVQEGNHPSGEPVLRITAPFVYMGALSWSNTTQQPLHEILAMDRVSSHWRHLASDNFFSYNVFDLTSMNGVNWVEGLAPHQRERLGSIVLFFDFDLVSNRKRKHMNRLIRAVGQSCRLRKIKIWVIYYGSMGEQPTPAQQKQMFRQMPGIELLSRLRGIDELVVDAAFRVDATEVRWLEQCLAKPKGRQGPRNNRSRYHYPALALESRSIRTLRGRNSAELDSELVSYGSEPTNFGTKVSKAVELKRLRELDWKNPDEP